MAKLVFSKNAFNQFQIWELALKYVQTSAFTLAFISITAINTERSQTVFGYNFTVFCTSTNVCRTCGEILLKHC